MKNRPYIVILMLVVSCLGWFTLAKIREDQAPVPGWIQYGNTGEEDPKFSFWLPKYYESMNPAVVTRLMQDATDNFGNQFSSLFDEVKIIFAARDTRRNDVQPNILVSYSDLATDSKTAELALEEIHSRIDKQPNIKLVDSVIRSVNDYRMIFLTYDMNIEGSQSRQIQYIFFTGDVTWNVIFVPNQDVVEEELSIFEQIIQTFKVNQ